MSDPGADPVTRYLAELEQGDRSAVDRLLPHIYDDLRSLAERAFRGRPGETLQPTALVHEAYLRLVKGGSAAFTSRRHFLDVAAMAMRQLLANQAEKRRAAKRGGDRERMMLESDVAFETTSGGIDLIDLDDLLTELATLDARQARIVELRYLTGLTVEETAEILGVSESTVAKDWRMARSWLGRRLDERKTEG